MDDLTPWSDVQHALEVTAFEAVREVIRTFPGSAERNAVVWRGVQAYGAVVGPEAERLRKLTATCTCGTPGLDYEGPQADCAVHGAIRAFDEVTAEVERLRKELEAEARRALLLEADILPRCERRAERAEDERDALKAATDRVRAAFNGTTPGGSSKLDALLQRAADGRVSAHDARDLGRVAAEFRIRLGAILTALDHPPDTEETGPVEHTGGNAEDCPRCTGRHLAYPFICPGSPPDTTGETETP